MNFWKWFWIQCVHPLLQFITIGGSVLLMWAAISLYFAG